MHCARIVDRVGPLQVLYSGKAHPRDELGKALIERVNAAAEELAGDVTVVYLEDYGMSLAALLVAGVDVWVNTPVAPHEASGTSGMKAALNGVPSLSILDGWWVEGHVEGVTGWAVGSDPGARGRPAHRRPRRPTGRTRPSSTGCWPTWWHRCTTGDRTRSPPSAAPPWP